MHFRTEIRNVTLVNEGRTFLGSLLIDDDRIDRITEGEVCDLRTPADKVIDGTGCFLLPGIIDTHVHFRDPGLTRKGDFFSESKAAAAGGVTTVFDMPNCVPQTTTAEAFREKWKIASSKSVVNFGICFGATQSNASELSRLDRRKVAAVKLFMGSSTGNMLVDDEADLLTVFEQSRLPIIAHCEDSTIITENLKAAKKAYGPDPAIIHHPEIRSEEACLRSTELALKLAKQTGARLHVAHLSTAAELELLRSAGENVTAEACVGHLLFSSEDYARFGTRIKVNPAIKSPADRDALRKGLTDGSIFSVATDHAPHTLADKVGGCVGAASGMPIIQFSLLAMLSLVDAGVLDIAQLVKLMCHHPADLFSIENRGYLREGYMADLVLVRPHVAWTLTPNKIQSSCNWSPLEGQTFRWKVERTFCNGFPIYNRGHITDEKYRGRPVCFAR